MIMFGVNWRQVGWPERPQSEHDTKSSGTLVLRFSRASPKQKSQYGDGGALGRSFGLRMMRKRSSSSSFGVADPRCVKIGAGFIEFGGAVSGNNA